MGTMKNKDISARQVLVKRTFETSNSKLYRYGENTILEYWDMFSASKTTLFSCYNPQAAIESVFY